MATGHPGGSRCRSRRRTRTRAGHSSRSRSPRQGGQHRPVVDGAVDHARLDPHHVVHGLARPGGGLREVRRTIGQVGERLEGVVGSAVEPAHAGGRRAGDRIGRRIEARGRGPADERCLERFGPEMSGPPTAWLRSRRSPNSRSVPPERSSDAVSSLPPSRNPCTRPTSRRGSSADAENASVTSLPFRSTSTRLSDTERGTSIAIEYVPARHESRLRGQRLDRIVLCPVVVVRPGRAGRDESKQGNRTGLQDLEHHRLLPHPRAVHCAAPAGA